MTAAEAPAPPAAGRRRQQFHPLRVAAVKRLCDDAVAVTFDVPDDLRRSGSGPTRRRT